MGVDGPLAISLCVGTFTVLLLGPLLASWYPGLALSLLQRCQSLWYGFRIRKKALSGGMVIQYMERGDPSNPTLLLVHGFSASKEMWLEPISYLPRDGLHIVALDLPSHGGSSFANDAECDIFSIVNRVHEFCITSGLSRKHFHLAGISMGGLVAGLYAASFQEDLSSVTLMCPSGIDTEANRKRYEHIAEVMGENFSLIEGTPQAQAMFLELAFHQDIRIPRIVLRGFAELQKQKAPYLKKIHASVNEEKHRFCLTDRLSSISMPTLVIWGRHDKVLDLSCAELMKNKVRDCRVRILENAGHGVTNEEPQMCATLMMDFIHEIEAKKDS